MIENALSTRLAQIALEATKNQAIDAREYARQEIGKFTDRELRDLAIEEVAGKIERFRRAAAQIIERQAAEQAARVVERDERVAWREQQKTAELSRFESWLENPGQLQWDNWGQNWESYPRHIERRRFMKWLGEDRYQEWYDRGVAERPDDVHFASDFYIDGSAAYFAEKRQRAVERLIEEVREDTRLEVTAELMETLFALGDGSRVTWGDATIDQHEQRLDMLKGNLSGLAETAGRHARAIEMLKESGAGSLRELAN